LSHDNGRASSNFGGFHALRAAPWRGGAKRMKTTMEKVFAICVKKRYHYLVRMNTASHTAEYFYFWYYFAQTGGGTSA
jgi:hypothetical protein